MHLYVKDPEARIDYQLDWGAAYLGDQLIAASEWVVAPQEAGGLSVVASSHDGRRVAVTVEGGRPGRTYDLVNTVELTNGTADERSLALRVEQR